MLPKRFTNIFYAYDEFKRLNLLFQNDIEGYSLYFDGMVFVYQPFVTELSQKYLPLKNTVGKDDMQCIQIVSISQRDDDMTFILFGDGTLFQLYQMMDDENTHYRIAEFSKSDSNANAMTPLGITEYEAAIKRYESGKEIEINFS